jgi:hypothetical protein
MLAVAIDLDRLAKAMRLDHDGVGGQRHRRHWPAISGLDQLHRNVAHK